MTPETFSIPVTVNKNKLVFTSPDSNWTAQNLQDFGGWRFFFRSWKDIVFGVFGRKATDNMILQGYKYSAATGTFNEYGGAGSIVKDTILDRFNAVNRVSYLNKGGKSTLVATFPSSATGLTYATDIAGSKCGFRFRMSLTSLQSEYPSATYDFVNFLNRCPDSVQQDAQGQWVAYFTQAVNTTEEYVGVLSLIAVNGVQVQSEAEAAQWADNYTAQESKVRQQFLDYMHSFKTPPASFSENQQLDYYRVLWSLYMGIGRSPMDHPETAGITDNFNISCRTRHFIKPTVELLYYGQWTWDSALALQGIITALNSPSPYLLEVIQDIMLIWAATQAKYPNIKYWQGSIFINPAASLIAQPQPADLFCPVVIECYRRGFIDLPFLRDMMYPALQSFYMAYKAQAGSDYLLSRSHSMGRDGGNLLPIDSSTSAETGVCADFAMMALGMATLAQILGKDYAPYIADFKSIKLSFQTLWRPEYNIYWNVQNGSFKDGGIPGNLGSSPYGIGLAILSGIVPSDKIVPLFNVLEASYVDHRAPLAQFPDGIGYTSVPTTATYYDPHTQWNGPTWDWCDNMTCIQAALSAVQRFGLTQLQPIADTILRREFALIGYALGETIESYDSLTGQFATWSHASYTESGIPLLAGALSRNIYDNLDYSLIDGVVPPPPAAPTFDSLTVAPASVQVNQSFSITGTTTNADTVTMSGPNTEGLNPVQLPTDFTVSNLVQASAGSYTYFFKGTGSGGEVKRSIMVTVTSAPPGTPEFKKLDVTPNNVLINNPFSISGEAVNAVSVTMSGPDTEGLNLQQLPPVFTVSDLMQIFPKAYIYFFKAVSSEGEEAKAQLVINVTKEPGKDLLKIIISGSLFSLLLLAIKR